MAERFVVIGSNSFSGAHFVAGALESGAEVMGISRSPEPIDAFLAYKWIKHDRFTFQQLDLNRDLDRIEAVIKEYAPPYVVNFSAQGMVAQSWAKPQDWFMTNTVAMVNLHDRLRKFDFLKKFVQASTPEVYGSTSGLVKETAPFNPSTPYAVSKTACDMSLLSFKKAYRFPVAFTRAANVAGPGQALYRIIPKAVLCILTGKKLRLEGGGTSVRAFIHIRDVVAGTLDVCRRGNAGDVYHFSTDKNQSIRSVVEEVVRQMDAKFEDAVEVTPGRLGQDAAYLLDTAKAKAEFGWSAKIPVETIIAETIDWLKKNLTTLRLEPADYVHKE